MLTLSPIRVRSFTRVLSMFCDICLSLSLLRLPSSLPNLVWASSAVRLSRELCTTSMVRAHLDSDYAHWCIVRCQMRPIFISSGSSLHA
ncbi:hypothetical protein BD414DRAFT_491559 [Trametes punicea]|nr:hypothetical protein BD414DRAFT_491559 [Trametes punicea]